MLVPPAGLEPALRRNEILSLARLPISPRGQYVYLVRPILAATQPALSLCMPTDSIPVATLTNHVLIHSQEQL